MDIDKVFFKEAIIKVYKESAILEDDEMRSRTLGMLEYEGFSVEERNEILTELKEIDEMYTLMNYTCFIDGAVKSDPNNVKAASSFVIYLEDDVFYKFKYEIPNELTASDKTENTSSHMAEYQSLIILLRTLKNKILNPSRARIHVYTDSEVLKGQYYAEYRVSNEIQRDLRKQVFALTKHFEDVVIEWIPREENILANDLAQELIW